MYSMRTSSTFPPRLSNYYFFVKHENAMQLQINKFTETHCHALNVDDMWCICIRYLPSDLVYHLWEMSYTDCGTTVGSSKPKKGLNSNVDDDKRFEVL